MRMCSNISIETTRSKRRSVANALTSAVTTSTIRDGRGRRCTPSAGPSSRPRGSGTRGSCSAIQPRERAPAAAEVEHVHPVLDPGAGAGQREHRLLGVRERLDARPARSSPSTCAAGRARARRTRAGARSAGRSPRRSRSRSGPSTSPRPSARMRRSRAAARGAAGGGSSARSRRAAADRGGCPRAMTRSAITSRPASACGGSGTKIETSPDSAGSPRRGFAATAPRSRGFPSP